MQDSAAFRRLFSVHAWTFH